MENIIFQRSQRGRNNIFSRKWSQPSCPADLLLFSVWCEVTGAPLPGGTRKQRAGILLQRALLECHWWGHWHSLQWAQDGSAPSKTGGGRWKAECSVPWGAWTLSPSRGNILCYHPVGSFGLWKGSICLGRWSLYLRAPEDCWYCQQGRRWPWVSFCLWKTPAVPSHGWERKREIFLSSPRSSIFNQLLGSRECSGPAVDGKVI